jgi:hypothetical protein
MIDTNKIGRQQYTCVSCAPFVVLLLQAIVPSRAAAQRYSVTTSGRLAAR